MLKFLWIALGGACGSLLRFYFSYLFPFDGLSFPKATFLANLIASLILGLVSGVLLFKIPENEWLKYFMVVGFCGAFSTFSTFALDLYKLQSSSNFNLSLIYLFSSIIVSVGAIFIGIYFIKTIVN